jgi:hypothetical protein|tara:strand:- start:687 stop:911 length:225 start_codon:yes stop_codon:yes gene_type:complete
MDKTQQADLTPYYSNKEIRKSIDVLLHQNAVVQSSLGIDSTKEEKDEAHKQTKRIKTDIATLDGVFAEHCFPEY